MLKSKEFKPNPYSDFNSLWNVQVGSQVMAIYLGQQPNENTLGRATMVHDSSLPNKRFGSAKETSNI
jgi:hypothetical protein